jgi:arylsulfatase A-like enzyme
LRPSERDTDAGNHAAPGEGTTSGRAPMISRAAQALVFALVLGVPSGLVLAWLDVSPYVQRRDVLPVLLADALEYGVVVASAAVVGWIVAFVFLRRFASARAAGITATFLAFAVPVLLAARRINHQFLPGFREPTSVAWNSALVVAVLVGGYFLYRHLVHWQQEAWRTGKKRPLVLVVLAAVPVGAHVFGHVRGRDPGPDVLILLIDILRADHLGCYGYDRLTSPNIDRFAEDAVLFEYAISPSTFTKTSVASLFTGLDAHHHGVYEGTAREIVAPGVVDSDLLGDSYATLAEGMYARGLNTIGWAENVQVSAYMGFSQGFTRYYDRTGGIAITSRAYDSWRDTWADRTRYFAYMHFLDLHGPFDPRPPYRGRFGSGEHEITGTSERNWIEFKQAVHLDTIELTADDVHELEALHDEKLAYVDHYIGRILDELREDERYDDTLIILTSDHGEGFWEHGFISHSKTPFDELCRVPLIVKLPDSAQAGRRVKEMVGLVDLGPTLLEYVGAAPPQGIDGKSFLSLLLDPDADFEPRTRLIEVHKQVGIRTDRWKYLWRPYDDPKLFDLQVDPEEQVNCIADYPDVAEQFQREVDAANELRYSGPGAERVGVDPETQAALEAIGYM